MTASTTNSSLVEREDDRAASKVTLEEIHDYLRVVDNFIITHFREHRDQIKSLENRVFELSIRINDLEEPSSHEEAADAILAEANRLYAKGKAMKAGRS